MPVEPVTAPAITVQGLLLFILAGVGMILGALLLGAFVRRRLQHPVKGAAYECGEEAIGQSWVQFDLRFYVAALIFIVFDVEIALFYPWAVVYKSAGLAGLVDMLFFFGVLVVGYVYLWRFGYLDWVRSASPRDSTHMEGEPPGEPGSAGASPSTMGGPGSAGAAPSMVAPSMVAPPTAARGAGRYEPSEVAS
jgi:NADH-quinone oxidoreductase subunit A